jgi:hypothetical protein
VSKDSILAILGNGLFTISTKDELSKPPPPILMALCQESVPHETEMFYALPSHHYMLQ